MRTKAGGVLRTGMFSLDFHLPIAPRSGSHRGTLAGTKLPQINSYSGVKL
jgi:hypothetical protein